MSERDKVFTKQLKLVFKVFSRSPTYMFSFVILLIYVVTAIAVILGLVPPLPPYRGGWEYMYQPPSWKDFPWYMLGTEYTGRPLFTSDNSWNTEDAFCSFFLQH